MIRRFFFSAFFGTLVSFAATQFGMTRSSPVQAVGVGILSAFGFFIATLMVRGRVRRSQGEVPALMPGEAVILYGPGDLTDSGGTSKVWFYVTTKRLMMRGGLDEALNLEISQISELRPAVSGLFSGELSLVASGHGLLKLKVPDADRWHAAISQAIHKN